MLVEEAGFHSNLILVLFFYPELILAKTDLVSNEVITICFCSTLEIAVQDMPLEIENISTVNSI